MQSNVNVNLDKKVVHNLTEGLIMKKIHEMQGKKDSFTVPELLGFPWPKDTLPFYSLYGTERVAGAEMGKLVKRVCVSMGLTSKAEDRRGKENAITRHYFKNPDHGIK
jgi:hypothetical protein